MSRMKALVTMMPLESREEAALFESMLTKHAVRECDVEGHSLLWHACDLDDEQAVEALVRNGATRDLTSRSPELHLLTQKKSPLLDVLRNYVDDDSDDECPSFYLCGVACHPCMQTAKAPLDEAPLDEAALAAAQDKESREQAHAAKAREVVELWQHMSDVKHGNDKIKGRFFLKVLDDELSD